MRTHIRNGSMALITAMLLLPGIASAQTYHMRERLVPLPRVSSAQPSEPDQGDPTSPPASQAGTWVEGGWSPPTSNCSFAAVETQSVTCQVAGATAPDSSCTGTRPQISRTVAEFGGCSYTTVEGAWSACTGSQTRTVSCTREDGKDTPVSPTYCDLTGSGSGMTRTQTRSCTPPKSTCGSLQSSYRYSGTGERYLGYVYGSNYTDGRNKAIAACQNAGVTWCHWRTGSYGSENPAVWGWYASTPPTRTYTARSDDNTAICNP